MQEEGIDRRGVPELPISAQLQAGIVDAPGQVGASEIVGTVVAQRFAGLGKDVKDELAMSFLDVRLKIADFNRRFVCRRLVFVHAGGQQAAIGFDPECHIDARCPEIKQDQAA